jgi:hypothetical protein
MNTKLIIPVIFLAIVMVTVTFATMSVEKASTVHAAIQANTVKIVNVATTPTGFDLTSNDILTVTSTRAFRVLGMTCINVDPEAAENPVGFTTRIGTANTATAAAGTSSTNNPDTAAAAPGTRTQMLQPTAVGSYVVPAGQSLFFNVGAMTNEGNGNEDMDCNIQVLTLSDATVTATWTAA